MVMVMNGDDKEWNMNDGDERLMINMFITTISMTFILCFINDAYMGMSENGVYPQL